MELVNLAAFAILLGLAAAVSCPGASQRPGFTLGWVLYADALSALVVLLSAFVSLVCSIYAVGYFRHEERSGVLQEAEEWAAGLPSISCASTTPLCPSWFSPMMLVALANNLGILWVAVEGTTLASVFLVNVLRTRNLS